MSYLFISDNRPLMGLLNKSMAEMCSLAHIGVDLISNRARLSSLSVSRHFVIVQLTNVMHIDMTIALVVTGQCYALFYVHLGAKGF